MLSLYYFIYGDIEDHRRAEAQHLPINMTICVQFPFEKDEFIISIFFTVTTTQKRHEVPPTNTQ